MGFLRRLLGRGTEEHHHLEHPEVDAPGWDAITKAADAIHPGVTPMHWGTLIRFRLGGPDPLDGVSAYSVATPSHWHYVSYGLSELFAKESENQEVSGWGFELTFRLKKRSEAEPAPIWPVSLLQNLARYVFSAGNAIGPGDHMNANGPIALDEPTDLTAVAFVEDPQLPALDAPNGRLTFVQVVGLTGDEYQAAKDWSTDGVTGLLPTADGLLITDLARPSIRGDASIEARIREGIDRDGSSMGGIMVDNFAVQDERSVLRIRMSAHNVPDLLRLIADRFPRDLGVRVDGSGSSLILQPGPDLSWHLADVQTVHLDVPASMTADLLRSLQPIAGAYAFAEGRVVIDVEMTIFRDKAGREIDRVG